MTDIKNTYIVWLEDKIREHQTEVARLTVALDVFLEMPVRRLEGKIEREAKPKRVRPTDAENKMVRQQVLNHLGNIPKRPVELFNAMGIASTHKARKPYYNALTRMLADGLVYRDPEHRYALISTPKIPAQG